MGKFKFDKIYSIDRIDEPMFISIPFAQGVLKDKDCISVSQNGVAKPVQTKVTSIHKDGSIRHLFVRFTADVLANKRAEAEWHVTTEKPAFVQSDICLEETKDGFLVSTGAVTFEVANNSKSVFSYVRTGKGAFYPAENFEGPYLSSIGRDYSARFSKWEIVESGAVAVVMKCLGTLTSEMNDVSFPFETRITAYAGKPWIELSFRLINNTNEALTIKKYGFSMDCDEVSDIKALRNTVADSSYSTNYKISEEGESVYKLWDAPEIIMTNNEHCPETLYGTFFGDVTAEKTGVTMVCFQAAQNYPKAVEATAKTLADGRKCGHIDMWLLPQNDTHHISLLAGMAKEQSLMLYFHGADESMEEINHRSICYQMPDKPLLDAEVYAQSNTMIDIFNENKDFDAEDALILCGDAHARCFGFINWGDAPDPGYTNQGRGNGKFVWSNNEYDFPHAAFMLYAKTGIRRFLDICVISARHQIDIDVCHTPGDPETYGGQWEHCADHTGFRMVCSHQWVEGILDAYHATGDERFLDTALLIGDNILYLLDLPKYQDNGDATARETGWALRTLIALYIETWDEKWLAKNDWIINKFYRWKEDMGGWIAKYLDNTRIRTPFMTSVAIGSLMRYYRVFPDEKMKALIMSAVDDLIENACMEDGLFFYKELPSLARIAYNPLPLEAMAIGYELTGDAKYLKAGKRLFKRVTVRMSTEPGGARKIAEDSVVYGTASPKSFAQSMVPYAFFYRALDKAGMIENCD